DERWSHPHASPVFTTPRAAGGGGAPRRRRGPPPPHVRLLFSALSAAALAQPSDEPSDHERGQQERDDHAHADEHIGEKDNGAVLDGHGALGGPASIPPYRSVERVASPVQMH